MIQGILGVFDLNLALQITYKILLALALGGIVGLERERHKRPAGVRTFSLVSVGSCAFTILSYLGFSGADPSRIAAQIVSGIGFLGAGVVIHRKGAVSGLTSAAGIWAVAAVGMAVGAGKYFLALFGAIAVFFVLGLLRQWFKVDVAMTTRRTLDTELVQVRGRIASMGDLVQWAVKGSIKALTGDDHELARKVIEGDEQVNRLRYQVEEETLDILRAQHPQKIQLRTVLAATHIATNLERVGDYAKGIAQVRMLMGHEPLPVPSPQMAAMADQVCDMLQRVLVAFAEDDIELARSIARQNLIVTEDYKEIVEMISEKMSGKKGRHFERGARLLGVAHHLMRVGDRVTNIAERIIFVRTGALAEIDRDELDEG